MRCKVWPQLAQQKRSRQHDPKCRLKSSQVRSVYFNHLSQGNLTTISFWIPRDKVAPPTSQQIGQFPRKQAKYWHRSVIHLYFCFFLIHRRALISANQRQGSSNRAIVPRTVERSFLDPEYSFVAVWRILPTRFAKQKFAQLRTN